MNLNLNKKTQLYKKSNFVLYTVEHGETPFLYYHMIKNVNQIITLPSIYIKQISEATQFMDKHFTEYVYQGSLLWNDENYMFYEIIDAVDFIPSYSTDSWWKVTPYELLYTQMVLVYPIDKYYLSFFKENPNVLFLINGDIKYETPIVGYLGLGESELNEQFLLNDINYKKGYFFGTIEKAYFQSLFTPMNADEDIIMLTNHGYLTDIPKNKKIIIRDNHFYLNDVFIGNVPQHCKSSYTLYDFNEEFIYLKSNKPIQCTDYIKRKTPGCMIRYVLFLKKTSISTKLKKGHDSYTYGKHEPHWFPEYMVKRSDQFAPLSYHYSMDSHLDASYMNQKNKDTLIRIK